jgi:hypothetical protein
MSPAERGTILTHASRSPALIQRAAVTRPSRQLLVLKQREQQRALSPRENSGAA